MTDESEGNDGDRKRSTASHFGKHAAEYLDSDVHQGGDDLDQLATWCASAERGLDVATGAGHTAGALINAGVRRVVATDAAPEMVTMAATSFLSVEGTVCDAERLPFGSGVFDAVTCRIAAHHFPDPAAFTAEAARILEPGGTLAFEDNVAPDDDALDEFLNTVERTRDPTHIRSHRIGDWIRWFEVAGLTIETSRVIPKTLDYDEWLANVDPPPERRERLTAIFDDRPTGATETFEIAESKEGIESFANHKLLLRATR